MKYSNVIFFVLFTTISLLGQNEIQINSENYELGETVTNEEVNQVLERLPKFLERYRSSSMFSDKQSLITFQDLFSPSGEVVIYDDIYLNPTSGTLDIIKYLDNAENLLVNQGGHHSVSLSNVTIVDILKDSRKNIIINIELDKLVPAKYSKEGVFKPHPNRGFNNSLRAKISMDPYNASADGIYFLKIIGLEVSEPEEKGNRKETSLRTPLPHSLVSLFTVGTISNSNAASPSVGYIESSKISSYGLGIRLRRKAFKTINDGARFFDMKSNFIFGINAERANVTTRLQAFDFNTIDNFTRVSVNNTGGINTQILDVDAGEFKEDIAESVYIPSGFDNSNLSEESINMLNLAIQLGLEFRLIRFRDDRFYLGFGGFANYFSKIGNGRISAYTNGIQFPDSEFTNFPSQDVFFDNISQLDEAYNVSGQEVSNSEISPKSNFSYGVFLSPVYHKFINSSFGLEIGLDIHYSITSLYSNLNPISDQPAEGYILEDGLYENRRRSILEDHFQKNAPLKASLRFGIYYKL